MGRSGFDKEAHEALKVLVVAALGFVGSVAEFGLLVVYIATAGAENCNNGVARWECSDALQILAGVGLVAIPLVAFLAAASLAIRETRNRS